jgi:Ca2+-binding EF-hand superfamily protein
MTSKRNDIFALLDTRGVGTLTLDAIVAFIDALPRPPSHAVVTRIFNEFDKDGSGDIDPSEFGELLDSLGRTVGLSFDALAGHFIDAQYLRLFEMVDEDGGGTISRDEVKKLVESLQAVLKLKASTADVGVMFRAMGKTELTLEDFTALMKKIAGDKPISHVVKAFEEAQFRTKSVMQSAIQEFDPERRNLSPSRARIFPAAASKCLNCVRKENEMDKLRNRILELEEKLADYVLLSSTVAMREPSPVTMASSFVQPQENLAEALKHVAVAYEENKESQLVLFSAETHTKSERLLAYLESFERRPATFPAAFEQAHKAGLHAQSVVAAVVDAVRPLIAARKEYLAVHQTASVEDIEDLHAKIERLKNSAKALDSDLRWAAENTVTSRNTIIQIGLSSLPLVLNAKNLQEALLRAEQATVAVVKFIALLSVAYTTNASADVWVARGKHLTEEEVERAKSQINDNLVDKESIAALFQSLTHTTHAVNAIVSMTTARTKDRSVQATIHDDLTFESDLRSASPGASALPQTLRQDASGVIVPVSRAPRARSKKRLVDKTTQRYVDSLVRHYLQLGLKVPTNFSRAPQLSSSRHVFFFGSKKIDLSVVEDQLAVAVGGGFLMLDEFCSKFTQLEQARLERLLLGRGAEGRGASVSSRAQSPPRVASSSVAGTSNRSASLRSPSTLQMAATSR